MSLQILKNVKLDKYTSWLIGGEADQFCLPETREDVREAVRYAATNNIPYSILGGGSNVLISDKGVRGLVIGLRRFSGIEAQIENDMIKINCLSGTAKSELLKAFLKYKSEAALFLSGLPGDVGGGVVMNAGVAELFSPREFMDFVTEIEIIDTDGAIRSLVKKDLKISYRHCDGWQSSDPTRPNVITAVKIEWPIKLDDTVITRVREANKVRLSKQPLDMPSCGSVFKNPEGRKAAQLIDRCGLKGHQIGRAQVSLKHANFIVNLGGATALDTWSLIEFVRQTVKEKVGVLLSTEVVRVGEWSDL
jgi:UDP-N-acetylmuramate dehydrogenase